VGKEPMKIVFVEWVDANRTEKYHKDVAMPKDQELGLETNSSVGIVVEDTKEYIALAQTRSGSGWDLDIITIARVNIKLEKVLTNARPTN